MKPRDALGLSKPRVKTQPEEREWIARCQEGDARAYRALVERYQDRAYALAYRMVRSRSDAEEVAQDAFVRAWRSIREFRGDAAFGTWLYRILVRLSIDRAESLRGRKAREAALEDAEEAPAPGMPAPEQRGTARLVALLIDELPPKQRAAVMLYYYEDRSVLEIAEILSMPENTVKTHLGRARESLRASYERERRAGGVHGA